jgi:zinc/manganese transport system substrate-binding protein
MRRLRKHQRWLVAVLLALGAAACSPSATPAGVGVGPVVAAENVWGSIASQLGGDKVSVSSIVDNPNADPHDYEPTAADARLVASAGVVIENGIGYDTWAQKLLDANPASGRDVLNAGDVVGVAAGGNPHQWYSPPSVMRMIDSITATYKRRDPTDASYFDRQRTQFVSVGLRDYNDVLASIRTTFAGTKVGASESIFAVMAPSLGLDLVTPPPFLKAISEGTDPSAADKATIDAQIASRTIKAYVYNSQNATPDVRRQIDACRAHGIPVVTMTETLVPAGASFQQWQVAQLRALAAALAKATGA